MSSPDTDTAVFAALKDCLDAVSMHHPLEQIVAVGRARRRHRRIMGASVSVVAVTGLAFAVPALSQSPAQTVAPATGEVHIRTVAYTVDSQVNGTVRVVWDKQRYFEDRAGLQRALRQAGFPVLIKEGVFCHGADDDGYLNPSGVGRGVEQVMQAEPTTGGGTKGGDAQRDTVEFIFKPAAMPAGKQLFIGYLNAAQLAITHGAPGSVERLVPTGEPLICTTQAPPSHWGQPRSDDTASTKSP